MAASRRAARGMGVTLVLSGGGARAIRSARTAVPTCRDPRDVQAPGSISLMDTLIVLLAAAVTMRTLYPESHPRISQAIDQILAALKDALEGQGRDSLTFLIVGDDLVVEQQILRKST